MVWILGHSFIFWAHGRAATRCYSSNLGFDPDVCQVLWFGVRGLRLFNFESVLMDRASVWPSPDVLIVHLGGNDIGRARTMHLIMELKRLFLGCKALFPGATLCFSEVVPRRVWSSREFWFKEKIRRRLNRSLSKFLPLLAGFSYRHVELEGFTPGLYWPDGVHLSEVGWDIFNVGIQNIIERASVFCGGPCQA